MTLVLLPLEYFRYRPILIQKTIHEYFLFWSSVAWQVYDKLFCQLLLSLLVISLSIMLTLSFSLPVALPIIGYVA